MMQNLLVEDFEPPLGCTFEIQSKQHLFRQKNMHSIFDIEMIYFAYLVLSHRNKLKLSIVKLVNLNIFQPFYEQDRL